VVCNQGVENRRATRQFRRGTRVIGQPGWIAAAPRPLISSSVFQASRRAAGPGFYDHGS